MAKNAVTDWDTTAANNTDIGGISIQGTAPVSNFDDAVRTIMAQIATFRTAASFTGTTALGSAATITSSGTSTFLTLTSTDAGAAAAPAIDLYRNSASPAADDQGAQLIASGMDSLGNKTTYGTFYMRHHVVTDGSETGWWVLGTTDSGTFANRVFIGSGLFMNGATGSDKGAGTINATGYYVNGTLLSVPSIATAAQYRANTSSLMLTTDQVWSAAAEVTLTDAATITVDMSTFINAVVTLGGNRALGNPTNEKVGQSGVIRIVQDGTGSRTLSYGTDWEFAGGVAPVLSTAAGANDLLFYYVIATDRIFANLIKATA
jgi:hypothetical protein